MTETTKPEPGPVYPFNDGRMVLRGDSVLSLGNGYWTVDGLIRALAERDALRAEVERLREATGHGGVDYYREAAKESEKACQAARGNAQLLATERDGLLRSLAQTQRELTEAAGGCKRIRKAHDEMFAKLLRAEDEIRALKAAPPAVLLTDAEAAAREIRRKFVHVGMRRTTEVDAEIVAVLQAHTRAVDREALAKAIYGGHPPRAVMAWDSASEYRREEFRESADACIAHLSLPSPGEIDREAEEEFVRAIADAYYPEAEDCECTAYPGEAIKELARQRRAPRAQYVWPVEKISKAELAERLAGPAGTNTGEATHTPSVGCGVEQPAASPASPAPRKGGECEHYCPDHDRFYKPGLVPVDGCDLCGFVPPPSVQALDAGGEKQWHDGSDGLGHGYEHPPLSPPTGPSDEPPDDLIEVVKEAITDALEEDWGWKGAARAAILAVRASHRSPAAAVVAPRGYVVQANGYVEIDKIAKQIDAQWIKALRAAGVPLAEEKP